MKKIIIYIGVIIIGIIPFYGLDFFRKRHQEKVRVETKAEILGTTSKCLEQQNAMKIAIARGESFFDLPDCECFEKYQVTIAQAIKEVPDLSKITHLFNTKLTLLIAQDSVTQEELLKKFNYMIVFSIIDNYSTKIIPCMGYPLVVKSGNRIDVFLSKQETLNFNLSTGEKKGHFISYENGPGDYYSFSLNEDMSEIISLQRAPMSTTGEKQDGEGFKSGVFVPPYVEKRDKDYVSLVTRIKARYPFLKNSKIK